MTYKLLIIISFLFYLTGCNNPSQESVMEASLLPKEDSLKQKIFKETFSNNSTSPDFVVFVALDLNTNKSKEICCESDVLFDAFVEENVYSKKPLSMKESYEKAMKEWDNIIISVSDRTVFSFRSQETLKDIGYYKYHSDSLDWYSNDKTVTIVETIKKNFNHHKPIFLTDYSNNRSIYLKHILHRNGVFCGRDCESGNIIIRNVIK